MNQNFPDVSLATDQSMYAYSAAATQRPPVAVDLDGTLIRTDLLHEHLSAAILTKPASLHHIASWLLSGRARLKARLADLVDCDAATLPYRTDLLNWLRQEKANGRTIVLATGSNSKLASTVSAHLGIFDDVLSSDDTVNLHSHAKRDALVDRFGARGFEYIGNSRGDLAVWQAASRAHVAGHSPLLVRMLRSRGNLGRIFEDRVATLLGHLRILRPVQWAKNLLVLVPLFTAHLLLDQHAIAHALAGFLAFCLMASGVYIVNDLVDIEDDRHHPRKRLRPFASGAVSVMCGWASFPILIAASFAIAVLSLPPQFTAWLAAYLALTTAYSLWLKRKALVDVVALALLYTFRVTAGAAAIGVTTSFWLLSFSIFAFLSLALVKRYSELRARAFADQPADARTLRGRDYGESDLSFVATLGSSAGYMSVLILGLYIQDPLTVRLYSSPALIWPVCPIFLLWVSRAWLKASRGELVDDPVVFAVTDRVSWLAAIAIATAFLLAGVIQ